jgi:hypothetical protein
VTRTRVRHSVVICVAQLKQSHVTPEGYELCLEAAITFGFTTLLRRRKYEVLLALLLAFLVLQSFTVAIDSKSIWHDVTTTVLAVAIFLVVFERSSLRTFTAVFLVLIISIGWGHHLPVSSLFDHALSLAYSVSSAVFFWGAVWAILRNLFRKPVIGSENVFGAICGYLIAGQGWAFINALAYLLAPATFLLDPRVAPRIVAWYSRVALFAYYSYAQMLTIGYAAVTPLAAPATTLSLLGALFGLFYTAVIVSQFVGLAQSNRN